MSMDRSYLGDNPEDKNKPRASGTSKGKWRKFTSQPGSEISAYMSTGYKNAKTVARMAERFFTQGETGIQNEQERNKQRDQALSGIEDIRKAVADLPILIEGIRKAVADLPTVMKYYDDDVKPYILPDRSGSSRSHPPLGKLDGMSLEELQARKEKVQKLQETADNLSNLSQLVEQAESAKKELEAANDLRPLKHHKKDLDEIREVVQLGQTLKDHPGLDFTTLSQQCKELQRLIELEPKMVVARVQPAIFKEAEETMNPEDLEKFKELFGERNDIESALAAEYRKERDEYRWNTMTGLYTNRGPLSHRRGANKKLNEGLAGDELVMDAQIQGLLAKKQKNDKPVILVDFGGGFGLSMIRLAANHRAAIENGNLVIVVTNLSYLPGAEADKDGYSGVAQSFRAASEGFSPEEFQFVEDNQKLVRYIATTAAEFPSKLVQLQEKQSMSSGGTVDIIYERKSVMHTHAPDVTLAVFGELLSDQGTLYLDKCKPSDSRLWGIIQAADGRKINYGTKSYREAKNAALKVGVGLLLSQYAMEKIFEDETFYSVLAKSHAPVGPVVGLRGMVELNRVSTASSSRGSTDSEST